MKLITREIARKLTKAYAHSAATGESGTDVVAKFFTPWAGCTWFITEGWPEHEGETVHANNVETVIDLDDVNAYDWHLYGFCDLGDPVMAELGYVMLSDLKSIEGPFGLKVERDLHYSGKIADVLKQYGRAA